VLRGSAAPPPPSQCGSKQLVTSHDGALRYTHTTVSGIYLLTAPLLQPIKRVRQRFCGRHALTKLPLLTDVTRVIQYISRSACVASVTVFAKPSRPRHRLNGVGLPPPPLYSGPLVSRLPIIVSIAAVHGRNSLLPLGKVA